MSGVSGKTAAVEIRAWQAETRSTCNWLFLSDFRPAGDEAERDGLDLLGDPDVHSAA